MGAGQAYRERSGPVRDYNRGGPSTTASLPKGGQQRDNMVLQQKSDCTYQRYGWSGIATYDVQPNIFGLNLRDLPTAYRRPLGVSIRERMYVVPATRLTH